METRHILWFLDKSGTCLLTLEVDAAVHTHHSILQVQGFASRVARIIHYCDSRAVIEGIMAIPFPKLREMEFHPIVRPQRSTSVDTLALSAAWGPANFKHDDNVLAITFSHVWMPAYILNRFNQLSSLSIHAAAGSFHLHWPPLRASLVTLTHLETLELEGVALQELEPGSPREQGAEEQAEEHELTPLPHLHGLALTGSGEGIEMVLSTFHLPNLLSLEIKETWPRYGGRRLRPAQSFLSSIDLKSTRLRLEITASTGPSRLLIAIESGLKKFYLTTPLPSALIIKSSVEIIRELGLTTCDHLVLRGELPASWQYVSDDGWADLFDCTGKLKRLTLSGYGDRWFQLAQLVGVRDDMDRLKTPWPMLEDLDLRVGFWVRVEVVEEWLAALRSRQKKEAEVKLWTSHWELPMDERYEAEFRRVAKSVIWHVHSPGLTGRSCCPRTEISICESKQPIKTHSA